MTPDQRRALRELLEAHDAALDALRVVNREILATHDAFGEVAAQFQIANRALTSIVTAHADAIEAAVAANHAALDLLQALIDEGAI
jgi:hypothetical protein